MMKNQNNILHIIVSRMRFDDKDLLKTYLKVTKEILISGFNSQKNKNFVWGVLIYPEDIEYVKEYLGYDFIPFNNYYEYLNFVKLNDIKIQTRHDIDDYMSEDYIKKIQEIYFNNNETFDTFLIQFQPKKYFLHRKVEHTMEKYTNNNTSQFLTICQKNIEFSVYEKYYHGEMGQLTNNIITIGQDYVKWVIHGDNLSCKPWIKK